MEKYIENWTQEKAKWIFYQLSEYTLAEYMADI